MDDQIAAKLRWRPGLHRRRLLFDQSGRQSCWVSTSGITLLEVMVALGIMAIVLVAVYRLQIQSLAMERIAQFHTLAPMLAQQLVTDIELQTTDLPAADSGDFGEDYPGYSWQIEIRDVEAFSDPSGRALLKKIDLQIRLNRNEDLFTLRTYRLVIPDA